MQCGCIMVNISLNKYILLNDLVCSIVGFLLRVSLYFDEPEGRFKIQETSKKYPMIIHFKSSNMRIFIS